MKFHTAVWAEFLKLEQEAESARSHKFHLALKSVVTPAVRCIQNFYVHQSRLFMSASNPPDCSGIHFCKKKILPSFEARRYAVKSVSQMMVMMIILIAERIVESMCAVLCMIAFYFRLPAKSLRTYLLSEATSSRCWHEVLVEA